MGEAAVTSSSAIPAHVPPELVFPFDFRHDPSAADDPWDVLEGLSERPDIFFSPELGGYWVVTRAPLIEEVFRRHELFSSRTVLIPKSMQELRSLVNNEDPPDHARFRSLLANAMFSPRALAGVEEQARIMTRQLIDGFAADGRCEFVADFARPLPIDVFMKMLGLPREMREQFIPWVAMFFRADTREALNGALGHIVGMLDAWLDQQLANPEAARSGHMMAAMLDAEVDGRKVTKGEMLMLSILLVNAALDTTTSQMTHQMRYLAEHPEQRRKLVDDPALIPRAVEVMLRRFGMVNTGREVKADLDFHGVKMKAGEMVLCSTAIAGLDRHTYPEPRRLDFEGEERVKHWAFGSGVHLCPGAYLARLELKVLIEEILPRLPNLRVAPEADLRGISGITVSLRSLPLEWDPA